MEGMLKIASALRPISTPSKALDAEAHLFNTPAGTVDLKSGRLRPYSRADLITKVAGGPIANEQLSSGRRSSSASSLTKASGPSCSGCSATRCSGRSPST